MTERKRKLLVRFHGRFVFLESNNELTVLAMNMQKNKDVPADLHHAFMTAGEINVRRGAENRVDPSKDECMPTYRIAATIPRQTPFLAIFFMMERVFYGILRTARSGSRRQVVSDGMSQSRNSRNWPI